MIFMQSLLDPAGSFLGTEKNIKKYLKSISDKKIKVYYDNIELTPFPILLAKEYQKRFSKNSKGITKKNIKKKIRRKKRFQKSSNKRKRPRRSTKLATRYTKGVKIAKNRKR